MIKAKEYIKEPILRHILAHDIDKMLHYGIPTYSNISVEHILSVILYTDWTTLCTQFSATFRREHRNESLYSVKQRNAEYAVWSRLLRETVEYWGQNSYSGYKINEEWVDTSLEGKSILHIFTRICLVMHF